MLSLPAFSLILAVVLSKRVEFGLKRYESKLSIQAIPLEMLEVMEAQSPFQQLFTKELTNIQNLQYYGALMIGTSKVPLTFIFDTGSNEIWFPSVDCEGCQGGYSRYDSSSSSLYHQLSNTPRTIQYGKGKVWGYPAQDQVWFSRSEKVDNMPVLLVYQEQDFQGTLADGILGLAPLDQGVGNPGPFTLTYLKDNGIISERTLSFNYENVGEDSTMGFGELNSDFISDPEKKVTIPLIYKGILYYVQLSATHYGNTILSDKSMPALIDTGTSLIAAPINPLVTLLKYLRSQTGSLYTCMGGSLYCVECAGLDLSETLQFTFGQQTVAISYQDLFLRQGDYCSLLMSPIQSQMWILGDVFIRNFYVVIKYDESIIDLYPKESTQKVISNSNIASSSGFPFTEISIGIFLALVTSLIGIFVWLKCMRCCDDEPISERNEHLLQTWTQQ